MLPERPFDLEKEHTVFPWLVQPIFNWISDIELALLNTSHDQEGAQRYLNFCEEALQLLVMEEHRPNFERARAKALWDVGRHDEAETAIRKLLDEDPRDAWTWVWWSDFYSRSDPPNVERSREILQQGLQQPELRDAEGVREHLELLDRPPRPPKAAGALPTATPMQPTAPSRNGPCPCGSGKKYKKCCAP